MQHNFKKLDIWKRSMAIVQEIYIATMNFPKEERYGLFSQLRASAVSIPSNIAEGCGRDTKAQLIYFLDVSIGSNCEAETQIYLCHQLGYISESRMEELSNELQEIRRMIIAFQRRNQK